MVSKPILINNTDRNRPHPGWVTTILNQIGSAGLGLHGLYKWVGERVLKLNPMILMNNIEIRKDKYDGVSA